jgi:kynurenine formamidase
VLLDVPTALGVPACDPGYEITPADLERTAAHQSVRIEQGDVVLIRSGWGRRFDDGADAYRGTDTGVPGVSSDGAEWLARHKPFAAGADSIAFERLAPGSGHALLPAHRILLVQSGIYLIEALDLEALAAASIPVFTFVLIPLPIVGATGSPVRPIAVVPRGAPR